MKLRLLSGIAAVLLLFSIAYFLGVHGLVIASIFLCVIASIEYHLLYSSKVLWTATMGALSLLLLVSVVYTGQVPQASFHLTILCLCFLVSISSGLIFLRRLPIEEIDRYLSKGVIGLLYTAVFPALSLQITYRLGSKDGLYYIFYLLFTVFLGDTMAYFVGRSIGQYKILPNISPKKTYEGSVAGLIASVVVGTLFLQLTLAPPMTVSILLSLLIGFFGQMGDFFESITKRLAGKKDTGKLMPGHGGLLDRFDGLFFASAFLASVYYMGGHRFL